MKVSWGAKRTVAEVQLIALPSCSTTDVLNRPVIKSSTLLLNFDIHAKWRMFLFTIVNQGVPRRQLRVVPAMIVAMFREEKILNADNRAEEMQRSNENP